MPTRHFAQYPLTSALLVLVLLIGGCARVEQVKPEPKTAPQPVVIKPEKIKPKPKPKVVEEPKGVTVIFSRDNPAIDEYMAALMRAYEGKVRKFVISKLDRLNRRIVDEAERLEYPHVIGVGLEAAELASQVEGKKRGFCRVMAYRDDHLLTAGMYGVSAFPNAEEVLRMWKSLYPPLKRIAIFSGSGMEDEVSRIKEGGVKYSIEVDSYTVQSDRELTYIYRDVADKYDGVWLIPDDRVLSLEAIRDVVTSSLKLGRQVVVFNESILKLGGVMSAMIDIDDEVVTLRDTMRNASSRGSKSVDVHPLNRADIEFNIRVVEKMGLTLPEGYGERDH